MTVYMDVSAEPFPGMIGLIPEEETPPGTLFGRAGLELDPFEGEMEELLESVTDLRFTGFREDTAAYPFYPVPFLSIFAVTADGAGYFAEASGWPAPQGSTPALAPIVYIDQKSRTVYRVANSTAEFLPLVLYWPGWRAVLTGGTATPRTEGLQRVADKLQARFDPGSIEKLRACLGGETPALYPSFEQARRHHHIITPRELVNGTAVWPWEG